MAVRRQAHPQSATVPERPTVLDASSDRSEACTALVLYEGEKPVVPAQLSPNAAFHDPESGRELAAMTGIPESDGAIDEHNPWPVEIYDAFKKSRRLLRRAAETKQRITGEFMECGVQHIDTV